MTLHAMSAAHSTCGDVQPALHNCGPGPGAVYRTAPAGTVWLLDLFAELHTSRLVHKKLREPFAPFQPEYSERLPVPDVLPASPSTPNDVVPLIESLLHKVSESCGAQPRRRVRDWFRGTGAAGNDARSYTEQDALQGIRQLAQRLGELGCLVPIPALVTWLHRSPMPTSPFAKVRVGEPLPWMPATHSEQAKPLRLAWLVCAYAYAAPPLVLFSRTPSLRFFRGDGALSVRWLGEAGGRA
jgi:hypothetical protein